jgi:hypothetical protein
MRNPFLRDDMLTFDDGYEISALAEVHCTGTTQEESEGFVVKEILRTGEWPVIPTKNGIVKKPLKIVKEGQSDRSKGIIAMSEVVDNFSKTGLNVQIPLSDDDDDHKNLTRLNTGFIRDVWIEDKDGGAVLKAKMDFTDPSVKEKVLNGSYADVSCGIPWEVVSRGNKYGSTLEHVAITNRPFIDGLGPFLALSDNNTFEVDHFGDEAAVEAAPEPIVIDPFGGLSLREIEAQAQEAITQHLRIEGFEVVDFTARGLVVKDESNKSWTIPFTVEDGKVIPASEGWIFRIEEAPAAPAEQTPAAPHQIPIAASDRDSLEAAQRERDLRFSNPIIPTTKEQKMPLTREELDALQLSDEQKAAILPILDENVTLSAKSREGEADKRISELEDLGLKDRPGFLKLYRQVQLSDDGGTAVVLLSDDGQKSEAKLTAKEILDRAIDALTVDGKVVLSNQAIKSDNDNKPPVGTEEEVKPLDERLADAKVALGKN